MDVEDRIHALEKLLNTILKKLESIEDRLRVLGLNNDVISTASKLVITFSLPATVALEAAKRVISIVKLIGEEIDPITLSIIEVLSNCERLNVSEITRRVRSMKGTASRRIIKNRIIMLERRGIVVNIGKKRPKYILKSCLDKGKTS